MTQIPRASTIAAQFESVVERCGSAIAIDGPLGALTFNHVNAAANCLARRLQATGLPVGAKVGISLARGPLQVIAILAVLKARGCYLPIDATYPTARRDSMLQDARCHLMLRDDTSPAGRRTGQKVITVFGDVLRPTGDESNLPPGEPFDHAYIIYTSGSTGEPKGCVVANRGVVDLVQSVESFYGPGKVTRQYQFFSVAFDASVLEIFFPLLTGNQLVVDADGPRMLSPDELLRHLDEWRVDSLLTTPTYLERARIGRRAELKTITVCGERCPLDLAVGWSRHVRFINAYGPTENTVAATMGEVLRGDTNITIGRPLRHVTVKVMDHERALPRGEVGELVLGGTGVAIGYHGRSSDTDAVFVRDWRDGSRSYRTGDLVRQMHDGRLEYLGRVDRQSKIRGFRVELGEIEATIRRMDGVHQCVAVIYGDGSARQIAVFVVGGPSEQELRRLASERLPAHMIPALTISVSILPTLPNGKCDIAALMDRAACESRIVSAEATPSLDPIAAAWRDALGLTRLDESANFFDAGGQSVSAATLIAAVRAHFNVEVPLRTIYEHPTLGAFRACVEARVTTQANSPA